MARLIVGAVLGVVVSLLPGMARAAEDHVDQAELDDAAAEAGVDPIDLRGAVNSTGMAPRAYLVAVGDLTPPKPPPAVIFSARVECIISKESGGANVANRRGSGAVGVAQYMPSTFAAHAAEMGHFDWSPWDPDQARAVAAHDLALGRRAQWTVSGC